MKEPAKEWGGGSEMHFKSILLENGDASTDITPNQLRGPSDIKDGLFDWLQKKEYIVSCLTSKYL